MQARKEGRGVRVIGSGHSFNNLTEPAFGKPSAASKRDTEKSNLRSTTSVKHHGMTAQEVVVFIQLVRGVKIVRSQQYTRPTALRSIAVVPVAGGYVVNLHDNYKKVIGIQPLKTPEFGYPGAPPVTAYATVQAGIRLKDLCAQLEAKGYGVHNMGAFRHEAQKAHL